MSGHKRLVPLLPAPPHLRIPPPPEKRKKIRIAVACEACHSRKTKCDGERPKCHKCHELQTPCSYPDRQVATFKRKYEQLKDQMSAHAELFNMLRTMPEQESSEVFRRIRDGVDPETILSQVKDGNLLMQLALVPEHRTRYEFPYIREMPAFLLQSANVYTNTLIYDYPFKTDNRLGTRETLSNSHTSIYTTPYHAAAVVDGELDLTRPSEWTLVCSNNHLMRGLLRGFFLSEYHVGPFFQKDHFFGDMAAGRHMFCSSLLVNAVLAWACFCDRDSPCRAEFWNPDNLGYRFLAEARRLWELEATQAKLTTLQTALCFNIIYNMNGVDKLGYYYNTQAVAMAKDLQLFQSSPSLSRKEQDARDFTAWVLYAWQGTISYMTHKPSMCRNPPVTLLPDPLERPDWYGEIRFRFPTAPTVFSSYFGQFLRAKIQLWAIAARIASELFDNDEGHFSPSADQILAYCQKLRKWYTTLPEPLKPQRIVTPYQLQLHMQYHNFMVNLLEEPMMTELRLPENNAKALRIFQQQPQEMLSESKCSLEILIRLYYLRHGFEANNAFMVQYLSLLAFSTYATIQADRHSTSLESLRSTIVLAVMGLRDQSHSHYLGQLVFNVVRNGMGVEEVGLIDRFIGQGHRVGKHPPKDWQVQSIWAVDFGSITSGKPVLNNLVEDGGNRDLVLSLDAEG